MAQDAAPVSRYVQLINLKSLATTALIAAQDKRFIVTACRAVTATKTGAGDAAAVSFGQSASFDNIISIASITSAVDGQQDIFADVAVTPSSLSAFNLNGNGISVKVQDVGDWTTHTAWVIIEGYFLT